MSWVSEVQYICGDYMIDIKHYKDQKEAITLFFNSSRNAETVKRCLEVDDSVPNVATAVDFVEVVRCKNCKHSYGDEYGIQCTQYCIDDGMGGADMKVDEEGFCHLGERKAE